ncbi:MAG: SBBP repeat-containing protein [Acidobacteriota bacterium]|nr:SBBP repeat-containing protein [Acidobacteriota bacterium]
MSINVYTRKQLVAALVSAALLTLCAASLLTLTRAVRETSGRGGRPEEGRRREQAIAALVAPPVEFELNEGQADPDVRFVARGHGHTLFLTSSEAVFWLSDPEWATAASSRAGLSTPPASRPRPAPSVLRMKILGAARDARVAGQGRSEGHVNYLVGSDPARQRTNVPLFERVHYESVYPGIDLVYYGNQQQLEFDFALAPGAEPGAIKLAFEGADRLEIDERGDLLLHVAGRKLVQRRPLIYQEGGGAREEVAGRYVSRGGGVIGFEVGEYDPTRELVIDPVLTYASYQLSANDIDLDADGNVYLVSSTQVAGLPTTPGAFQGSNRSGTWPGNTFINADIYLRKLAPVSGGGFRLVYATYIGGFGDDSGGVAVDKGGNVYVAGTTNSADFPVTQNAAQKRLNRGTPDNTGAGTCCRDIPPYDAFVMKFGPGGDLRYSSYHGGSGSDGAAGPLLDGRGNVFLVGNAGPASNDFPVTANAFQASRPVAATETRDDPLFDAQQRGFDLFITKISLANDHPSLLYSTYFGGNRADRLTGAAVDQHGNVYLMGETGSSNFPVTANAVRADRFEIPAPIDIPASTPISNFVVKFDPAAAGGSPVAYGTILGSTFLQRTRDLAVDRAGKIYVLSKAHDPAGCNLDAARQALCEFPVTPGAMQPARQGGEDALLVKLDPSRPRSLVYSTYFGGSADDDGFGLEPDEAGNAYVVGRTFSTDFPVTPGVFQTAFGGGSTEDISAPGGDGYVAKVDAAGASLVYLTYLGGAAGDSAQVLKLDGAGGVYASGWTFSQNFPVTDHTAANPDSPISGFLVKIMPEVDAGRAGVSLDAARAVDPLYDASKFVRQHYLDFLNREPDAAGHAFWTREITGCGGDEACAALKRLNVSAAFFLSIEFQRTGYLVYRSYRAAFGRMPSYEEFTPDAREISRGVTVGTPGWESQLRENERAFLNSFVERAEFRGRHDGLSHEQYVEALHANAGVRPSPAEREALVAGLRGGSETRASVLAKVAGGEELSRREFTRAFVLMQYFGYLKRTPDEAGYNFWLSKLNDFGGNYVNAQMVEAFITSFEYRDRFKTMPRAGE